MTDYAQHWVRLRNGQEARVDGRGTISSNVLIGRLDDRPICWNGSGRWRWDDQDHPLDLLPEDEVG